MLKNQRLTVALALALGSSHALALGLGTISVQTKLNEPLKAEIPIIGSTPKEIADLQVRLASPDAFARVGLDRPAVVSANLEFSVVKDKDGKPVVRVTTPNKVRDPYIGFLLEVQWGRGKLLREYSLLLDPPVMVPVQTAPVPSAPVAQPVRTPPPPPPAEPLPPPEMAAPAPRPAQTPPPPTQPAPAVPSPSPTVAPTPTPLPAPPAQRQDNYGPVRDGETLWSIAQFVRPDDSVSMNQVMLALLADNPDAFIGGNINRLKKGAVLRIPSAEQIRAISQQAATAQVIEQTREWRAGSGQTLQPEAPTAPRPSAPSQPVADSRLEITPPKGDQPASTAQSGASAGGQGAELRADLQRSQEQVSTLQQENRELSSRVDDLERIDADSKRLIELKNSELAAAQARVQELERQLAEASAQPASTAASPAVDLDAEPAPVGEPDEARPAPAIDDAEPAPAPAEDALVDVTDVLDEMDAVPSDASPAEPADAAPATSEPIPLDSEEPAPSGESSAPWYSNPFILGGGAGVLVLLGLLLAMGRRKKSEPATNRPSVADNYAAAAAAAEAKAQQVEDEESMPVQDPEQALVDAIAEQPDDLQRHLALVRHYYEAGDASGFEGAAEAMYAQLFDPEDRAWRQVVAMGRELLPDHPLFAQPAADSDADVEAEPSSYATHPEGELTSATDAGEPQHVEWDAADDATTQSFRIEDVQRLAEEQATHGDELGDRVEHEVENEPAVEASRPLDLDREEEEADLRTAAEEGFPGPELSDTSLDADDAAATKLELARAYLDMGDVEGARGMLEEVVNEGNAGQRSEAKRLLDEIR